MAWKTFIDIKIEDHGTIQLRSHLTLGDIEVLQRLAQDERINSRDFTVEVIHRLLHRPELNIEEVRAWNDSQLQQVIITWAKQKSPPTWEISEDLEPFDAIKQGFELYVRNLMQNISETFKKTLTPVIEQIALGLKQFASFQQTIIDAVQQSITPAISSLQTSLTGFMDRLQIEIPLGQLFQNLPDLSEISKALADYVKAADSIEAGGFPFLLRYWTFGEITQFVGVDEVDARIRNAVVTNKLLSLTRHDEFQAELENLFHASSVLKRRWHIVEEALLAHRSRNYAIAIPTLLAQVEGIFTDALILKQLVERVNGKLYAKDSSGNLKLDRNGKPIQLHGLGQKVNKSDLQNEYLLKGLADFFTNHLVSERNEIMHGSNISYNRAKLSIQLILNIYLLAVEFADFESEH